MFLLRWIKDILILVDRLRVFKRYQKMLSRIDKLLPMERSDMSAPDSTSSRQNFRSPKISFSLDHGSPSTLRPLILKEMARIKPPKSCSDSKTMNLMKALSFVAAVLPISLAEKDSDYYPPGVSNPNMRQKMYWKDAVNVLQDLDQFESLHILYHGCV